MWFTNILRSNPKITANISGPIIMEMSAPSNKKYSEDTESAMHEKMNNNVPEEKSLLSNTQLKNRRKKRVKEHFDRFLGDSTCHGMHYCFDAKYRIRRLFWTVLVLASLMFLAKQVWDGAVKYMAYPFTTTTTLVYVEQQLPAISICNLNDFRKSKMENTTLGKLIAINAGSDRIINEVSPKEYAKTTLEAYHTIKDMIDTTGGLDPMVSPNYTEFTPFFKMQGEKCYTYKPPMGMKMVVISLDIEFDEYDNKTGNAGINLILHNADEVPVAEPGLIISPGFKTNVQVAMTKTQNLPHPYKTNCGSIKLKYFGGKYSKEMCNLEKLTDYVVDRCQCKDSFMPAKVRVCSLKELFQCAWPKWDEFKKLESECPLACEQTLFESQLSTALYPTNALLREIAAKQGKDANDFAFRQKVRENRLQFEVRYVHNYYEHMIQEPTYDVAVMLGDLGGKLGLFLGTSILTYIEFFDYLALIIFSRFFEK